MRTSYLFALTALVVVSMSALPAFAECGATTTGTETAQSTCPDCGATWDGTPVTGAGPSHMPYVTKCGAFCEAGQTPAGWPFDWSDHYWLQPDSNL